MRSALNIALVALLASLAAAVAELSLGAPPAGPKDEREQLTIRSLDGGSRRVDFSASETVGQLKKRLAALDGSARADSLRLVYAGRQLDDQRLLSDYGIQRDSSLISLRANNGSGQPAAVASSQQVSISRLTVRTITGETFEVPAHEDMTVGQLKDVIELLFKKDVPAERQQLVFQGRTLDDERGLAESGLREDATVTLTISMASGRAPTAFVKVLPLTGGIRRRLVAALVQQFNSDIQRPTFKFKHDAQFADVELVRHIIGARLAVELPEDQARHEIMSEVFMSDELRLKFQYEMPGGGLESTVANLKSGAQWVADQAQATLDAEQFERDVAAAKRAHEQKAASGTQRST